MIETLGIVVTALAILTDFQALSERSVIGFPSRAGADRATLAGLPSPSAIAGRGH